MIYLATPIFSDAERDYALKLTTLLENQGHIIYYPWRDAGDSFYETVYGKQSASWREAIFTENVLSINRSRVVIAILDGSDVDSGVAWEVGYAQALGKEIYALRSDFRTHSLDGLHVNLMVAKSAQKTFNREDDLLYYTDHMPKPERLTIDMPFRFYDEVANEYQERDIHARTAYLREQAEELALDLIPDKSFDKVLDIGGGTSMLVSHLKVNNALIIDPSKEMVHKRTDKENTAAIVTDFEDFDAPNESFDLITSLLSIDHVAHLKSFVQKASRLLKSGGHCVIIHQHPFHELKHRESANHFCFDSFELFTRFYVRSEVKKLVDLPVLLSQNLRINTITETKEKKLHVSPLIGVHCIKE